MFWNLFLDESLVAIQHVRRFQKLRHVGTFKLTDLNLFKHGWVPILGSYKRLIFHYLFLPSKEKLVWIYCEFIGIAAGGFLGTLVVMLVEDCLWKEIIVLFVWRYGVLWFFFCLPRLIYLHLNQIIFFLYLIYQHYLLCFT